MVKRKPNPMALRESHFVDGGALLSKHGVSLSGRNGIEIRSEGKEGLYINSTLPTH